MRRMTWLFGMAAMAGLATLPTTVRAAEADAAQIVVFRLSGSIPEAPPEFDFFQMEQSRSLHDLLEKIRKAKKDDNVKAVLLTFEDLSIGWAQMQELRQAVADLRAAEKEVYAYLEDASAGIYLLGSAASRVVIAPAGEIWLTGMHIEQTYFKGLMDKIGVEADIEHVGAYKGAGEPFTRTAPSKEAAEMLEWLMRDVFEQMVQTVAESRQMTPEQARELIDRGPFTARDALESKLVDETAYVEDFLRGLKKRYGENAKLVYNYGARKGPEIDLSNPFAIFKMFGDAVQKGKSTPKPSIGVVYVDGMIVTGKTEQGFFGGGGTVGSTTLRQVLTKARDDDSVKAVVLRVDSPGGSALASDIMWHAAKELADKKPLVVSMGNVAASGGYYVSVGAGTIFADPATFTGSIGVVGGKIVTRGLWDWLGVSFHELNLGKNAGLMSSNRKFDERERALIRKYMENVYGDFTDRVKKGRGNRLKKDLEELAGGRVYTGRQALASGLVDKLGGLQDAIKFAAASANVSDYEIRLLPERKNFIDIFVRSLMGESPEDEGVELKAAAGRMGWTLQAPGIREALPALKSLDPARARSILNALLRIELLSRENTLMVLPGDIIIR